MSSQSKPLGGIAALTLGAVNLDGTAPTLPEGGTVIPLLEDRSTYTETVQFYGVIKSVQHTLTFYTAAEFELPAALLSHIESGFVSLIEFNSGEQITVGYSQAAAYDRALRLVSCSMSSGEKPGSRGYKTFVMASVDGESKI